jgi:PAS domain S-box-containing protein
MGAGQLQFCRGGFLRRDMDKRGTKSRAGQPLRARAPEPSELADHQLERYARWQETIATLGQVALGSSNMDDLMAQAARRLAQTLQIEYVAILEMDAQGQSLTLRAGHGWARGMVGMARVDASAKSQVGFTLLANEPVVLADAQSQKRFAPLPLLADHRVVSGVTVAIGGRQRPWGVLGVHSTQYREFAADEVRFLRTAANVLATAVRSFQADQARKDGTARVRAIVNTLVDGIITIDEHGIVESVNPAAEKIFGYAAVDVIGLNVNVLMPEPYKHEHDGYLHNYLTTGRQRIIGIGREVLGRRKDGTTFPMDLAVSELQVSGQRMFTGVVRDITERRRMEREILEAGADEQRRIGQDLHDGLCQHLAGISFATEVLRQNLAARSAPEASSISKVGKMVDDAITQARDLARGLQPVMLDANGLIAALKGLAEKVEGMFNIACLFVSDGPCPISDNAVSTHLYRIAQEAISNAVKHGKARTVAIDLAVSQEEIRLTIRDDGIGRNRSAGNPQGMGLRTMDYRARVIGGTLSIQDGKSSGTTVVCRVRYKETDETSERFGNGKEEGSKERTAPVGTPVGTQAGPQASSQAPAPRAARNAKGKDPRGGRSSHRARAPR